MEKLVGKNHREVGIFFRLEVGLISGVNLAHAAPKQRGVVNLQNKRTKICSITTVHNHIRQASSAHSIIKFGLPPSFNSALFSQTTTLKKELCLQFYWFPLVRGEILGTRVCAWRGALSFRGLYLWHGFLVGEGLVRSREARIAELSRSISVARVLTTSGCDFFGAIFVPPRKNGRKSGHFSKF